MILSVKYITITFGSPKPTLTDGGQFMKIVYSDRDIAVIVKPSGISSQSTPDRKGVPDLLSTELNGEIYTVHRLDEATAGLMVYARTKEAAAVLSRDLADRLFEKEYIARVHGIPEPPEGECNDLLFRDRAKNKSYVVKRERKGVKKASLEYTTLKTNETENGTVSTVRIKLHTGRTHQIRVQFSSRKMPLVGDGKYGARDGENKLALFCCRLSFKHPSTGEALTFEETPPFLSE